MDIDYRGANCVVLKTKGGIIVSDPTNNVGKVKEVVDAAATVLVTQDSFVPKDANFVISMPGEYEHNNISTLGVPVCRYGSSQGKENTMYRVVVEGVRIAILGHAAQPLSDDDLESLGIIDIAIVPIGGGGYTLDAREAAAVVRQFDPKIVIPTHYSGDGTEYDTPQGKIDDFTKELPGVAREKVDVLKIKNNQLPSVMTIYELRKK